MLWVAVRGSEQTIAHWLQNIDTEQVVWPEADGGHGKVHRGWYQQFEQIREPVLKAVDQHILGCKDMHDKDGVAQVYITGHSRGGMF